MLTMIIFPSQLSALLNRRGFMQAVDIIKIIVIAIKKAHMTWAF